MAIKVCKPALATLYADERIDHQADLQRLTLARIENAELRRQLREHRDAGCLE